MTPTELRHLCDTRTWVRLLDAFDAIGVGETAGRKAYARGELPFRVIRIGTALRVPVCDLAALLLTPDMESEVPDRTADSTTHNELSGARDADQRPTLRAIQHG